jgi:hypothetical protein
MDLKHMAVKVAEEASGQPVTSVLAGVAMQIVSVLQSAQTVASTLIAFVTSITGLVVAFLGLRGAWRNRNKDK